jgi:uncharacterized protein (DUF1778 family)
LHHPHINDFVIVAAKHNANNVLADVMNIALYSRQDNNTVVLYFTIVSTPSI